MEKTFKICKKINFDTETLAKQVKIIEVIDIIRYKMTSHGFVESIDTDKSIQYVFSVGGDGTMLHSMHQHISKDSIIIGINAGNVGFLTPYSLDDVYNGNVFSFIEKESRIEDRSILQHTLGDKKGVAVNEYAITAQGPNDMIEFSIEVEAKGHISRAGHYKANTVIISGPCGSTAYNMNAGGAIIDPSMKSMQIVMVAPTTLGTRPLITGKNSIIHVKLKNSAKIFADGMYYGDINPDDSALSISLMQKESHVLVPENWNFYSVLSKKLHWNNGRDV